jgi:hypothetical protein
MTRRVKMDLQLPFSSEWSQRLFTKPWHYWGAVSGGSGIILLCVVLEELSPSHGWHHTALAFVTELGIATVVAALLALTFERVSAREFSEVAKREREDAERNVFDHVFGHHLPEEVRDEIVEQIFHSPFTRRPAEIKYKLEGFEYEGERFLHVVITQKYTMLNTAPRAKSIPPFSIFVDRASHPALDERVALKWVKVEGCDIKKEFRDVAGRFEQNFIAFSVLPEEVTVKEGGEVTITYEYDSIRDLGSDEKTFHWDHHVVGLRASVELYGEMAKHLTVQAHSYGAKLAPATPDGTETHAWKLTRALLPGQGVVISWRLPVNAGQTGASTGMEELAPSPVQRDMVRVPGIYSGSHDVPTEAGFRRGTPPG